MFFIWSIFECLFHFCRLVICEKHHCYFGCLFHFCKFVIFKKPYCHRCIHSNVNLFTSLKINKLSEILKIRASSIAQEFVQKTEKKILAELNRQIYEQPQSYVTLFLMIIHYFFIPNDVEKDLLKA